jgi:hypothetical protein
MNLFNLVSGIISVLIAKKEGKLPTSAVILIICLTLELWHIKAPDHNLFQP